MKKKISIITPCFNEEEGIIECYDAIKKIFTYELSNYEYEHIFCDNCSSDNTVSLLKVKALADKHIKIIVNSRNFGILKNTYNGVLHAQGDAILLFMPADLQDPPELLPEFVSYWERGYEIVYGIRSEREEGYLLALARKAYYRTLSKITYVDYPPDVGDFQLIDRKVLEAMKQIEDAQPFMRLMTFDCGFKSIGIKYTWKMRKFGKSRNNIFHMLEQGLNGLVSFSGAPLRVALILGVSISFLSLSYSLIIFLLTLFGFVKSEAGIPTLVIALFFFGGVQLFFLGILGEYIFAIFNQVRRKPLVIIRELVNFDVE